MGLRMRRYFHLCSAFGILFPESLGLEWQNLVFVLFYERQDGMESMLSMLLAASGQKNTGGKWKRAK